MTSHARLKNEFTEDGKYHNLMTWLIWLLEGTIEIVKLPSYPVPENIILMGKSVFLTNIMVEIRCRCLLLGIYTPFGKI